MDKVGEVLRVLKENNTIFDYRVVEIEGNTDVYVKPNKGLDYIQIRFDGDQVKVNHGRF